MKPKIDPDLSALIPPLSQDEYNQLEENILKEGIRDKLIVWEGILLDGHNRLQIALKHGLDYQVGSITLPDRNAAKAWMITNQLGRRNINKYQRSVLALMLKPVITEKAKERMLAGVETDPMTTLSQGSTRSVLAERANVAEGTIAKVEVIQEKATPEVKEQLARGDMSINKAYTAIRREERRSQIKESLKEIELPEGQYDVIYCDPPWQYDFAETENRAIENHYPTMTVEEMKELIIPAADNSVLFMWATAPKLEQALELLNAWGFTYKTNAVWDKEVIGMGYWFRGQHELLLVGTKGQYSPPPPENRYSSVLRERRSQHSRKPEVVYDMIEEMFPQGKYIELFSRNKHNEKWTVWGNQL